MIKGWEYGVALDINIYQWAKRLIDQYGEQAPVKAAIKAGAALRVGDLSGNLSWTRVLNAIAEMRAVSVRQTLH